MKKQVLKITFMFIAVVCITLLSIRVWQRYEDRKQLHEVTAQLRVEKEESVEEVPEAPSQSSEEISIEPQILQEYLGLYEKNEDLVGWLKIADTRIDYPVMQTLEDENFYLDKGFDREKNSNGSLILDNDCRIAKPDEYTSTNLIIHGHHMRSGEMFGDLEKYMDKTYAKTHTLIQMDTLYEKRTYEVMAVFLSQVYKKSDECFKYYQFVEVDSRDSFELFYKNVKERGLFDTGVTATYGDEFLTLSTCYYHVEDGRLVVIAKRIK